MAKEKIVLEFEIDINEALENITNAREALVLLREEQKALQKEILAGTATDSMRKRYGELSVEIKELTTTINQNNREIQNQIKNNKSAEGSLAGYRAQIKNLKSAYEELSEEERNGAKGKELITKMDSLTNSAKAAEWQLQGVPKGLSKTVAAMSQVNFGAGRAAAGIAQITNAFKALMGNPIVLAIGAIVVVIKKLIDSFKKNDVAMTRLQKSMAPFKAILSVIERGFQGIVNVISKVIEGIGNFASKLLSIIPGMGKYVQAQEDIVVSTDNLEEKEREYATKSAERQAEISELRNKAEQSDKYNYKQRREFIQQAMDLEKEEAEEKKNLAVEKLRIAEEQAAAEIGLKELTEEAWERLSDETKNNLTELRVAVTNTTAEYNNKTREMTTKLGEFNRQVNSEIKQRRDNEKAALRELEDLTIEAMKSLEQKEIAQTKAATNRKIEDIKTRLKTETNLTKTAREALNNQIVLLEADLQIRLLNISKKYAEDRVKTVRELTNQINQELLKSQPDNIELQVRISDFNFESQIREINKRNKEIQDLLDSGEITGDEKSKLTQELENNNILIRLLGENATLSANKIRNEGVTAAEAVKKSNEEMLNTIKDNELLGIYWNNEVEKSKIFEEQARRRLKVAEEEVERLKGLSEEEIKTEFGTVEKYQLALNTATNNAVVAQNNLDNAVRETNQSLVEQQNKTIASVTQIAQATNQIFASFEELFNNMAEGNDKYSKYAKAMALMQILVSTAVSIANAVQGATAAGMGTGVAAPFTIPIFIAELVGIVSSSIASATGILKKAETPSRPKFAEGGLVGNTTTTRTDDTVEANLSVGEYVIKSASVRSIGVANLNTLNKTGMLPATVINSQQQFDMNTFKDILVEAVSEIHPTVSVREITDMQTRISVKESISKY